MNLLVTAGPTREHIDPVRFLSNPSTGKMGFAVAEAAAARGHRVTLVAGPVTLATPPGVQRVDITSAHEMLATLQHLLPQCAALVMTAAVADWRPKHCSTQKLKKATMRPTLELEPNPDILSTLAPLKQQRVFIGFAAETGNPLDEARRKLKTKGLDMIVANDVSQPHAGFASDTNQVTLLPAIGPPQALPLLDKLAVAHHIIAWLEAYSASGASRNANAERSPAL